jgi:DNA mismatch repair protein MutL
MVNRIHLLSSIVANQIAAGEVIERPFSVVKELLENAMDSGADSIHIEILNGGLSLIKVSDNGAGIDHQDLPLAVAAHATSKLSRLNDLNHITTMGFRGEALASIASVSKLSIISKPSYQTHAHKIEVQANEVSTSVHARAVGTTVEVRNLFYNAPVRKKFLKSAALEFQAIEALVRKITFSAPHISMVLKNEDKEIFSLPGVKCHEDELLRIKKLLGKKFLDRAGYLEVERAGIRLKGWVSGLDYQRNQNDKQWIYVNQRLIKDKLIHHAVKKAYQDYIYPGKFPSCLLFIKVPSQEVDVNVHPAKTEVRFQNPRLIHDLITTEISKLLHYPANLETPTLLVSEHRQQPESYMPPINFITANNELELIPVFPTICLTFIENQPFFINLLELHVKKAMVELRSLELPLKPRLLLTPIKLEASLRQLEVIDYSLLNKLGIEVNPIANNEIIIRSIPQKLPYLNVVAFVMKYIQGAPILEMEKLFTLLCQCQDVDVKEMAHEEKQMIATYILHHYKQASWCVLLSEEICKKLLTRGMNAFA